jgi:Tol biopolymer transport system component
VPTPEKDDEVELAAAILDAGTPPAPSLIESHREVVDQLQTVRALMDAFDSLGVARRPAEASPFAAWGPFVLKETLGKGSFGSVYRGFDPAVERDVAVKLYASSSLPSEPRLMARVRHPNVVTVFGAAVHDGKAGIWMELVHGRTLAERVQAEGPLSPEEAARIGVELCGALGAVHDSQLVHQDVKPRNVMEGDGGRIVLMDFGAGLWRRRGEVTSDGLSGTPLYMAPEVVLGEAPSPQSDLYSLGVLLYYLLTGTYPVYSPDLRELRALHERHAHSSSRRFATMLRELRPEVSPALAQCVAKALARPGRRYRSAAELGTALERVQREGARASGLAPGFGWPLRRIAAGAALVAVGLAIGLVLPRGRGGPTALGDITLTRLTADPGLTTNPALSPDGKLLAYASDRSGEGHLDIWVQQTVGGQPLRLTHDPADDHEPTFSPDGTRIAFRSDRDGGGVYVTPTFGGEARLLVPDGHWPRYSPDGTKLACILGPARAALSGVGPVAILPAEGGEPRTLPWVAESRLPIWSPDGTHILAVGNPKPGSPSDDWWIMPIDPSSPVGARSVGAQRLFDRAGLRTVETNTADPNTFPRPFAWTANRILFSGARGGTTNLWEVDLDPGTLELRGSPRRVTMGTDFETEPVADPLGRVIFAAQRTTVDLWDLAIDADAVRPRAGARPRPLTGDSSYEDVPSVSEDGRHLVYISSRLGSPDIWTQDLETGEVAALTATTEEETQAVLSPDGTHVVYALFHSPLTPTIYALPRRSDAVPEKICEYCGVPTDWTRNRRFVVLQYHPQWPIAQGGPPPARSCLAVLDRTTGQRTVILEHGEDALYRGQLSPDEKWIAFHGDHRSVETREYVAPFRGAEPVPQSEWIAVTDGGTFDDAPQWSPDGRSLYYVSDRDGFRCIWAQRLDGATKQPLGKPEALLHLHERRPSMTGVSLSSLGIAVGGDRIVFNMLEAWSNLWMVDFRPPERSR